MCPFIVIPVLGCAFLSARVLSSTLKWHIYIYIYSIYVHSFTPRHVWTQCSGNALDSCRGCGCMPWQVKTSKTAAVSCRSILHLWVDYKTVPSPQKRAILGEDFLVNTTFEGPTFRVITIIHPDSCILHAFCNQLVNQSMIHALDTLDVPLPNCTLPTPQLSSVNFWKLL